jgi:CarboxypepD_reg-like domain
LECRQRATYHNKKLNILTFWLSYKYFLYFVGKRIQYIKMISYNFKSTSLGITLIFLCLSLSIFAQNNSELTKEISGQITHLNAPLPNVNIIILDSKKGTKTDTQGNYNINAKVGDIIQYSYVGFNTISIIVEDITSVLNIEMTQKVNELDEAVVTAKKKVGSVSEIAAKKNAKFKTSKGIINPKTSGFGIAYVDGKDINSGYPTLADALNGKAAGVNGKEGKIVLRGPGYAIWDVDGQIFKEEPPHLDLSNIKDVHFLKALGSTMSYGSIGRSGVVVVRTNFGSYEEAIKAKKEVKAEQYRNQNYYNDDAVATNNDASFSSKTITTANAETTIKTIHGTVTYIDAPLANVNIIIVGKTTGTKTNIRGAYTIKAAVGDILQYSHVGFATVPIIVEDVTEILDIEMVIKENELDEVTVTANGKIGETLTQAKKAEESFETSRGNMDPKRTGFAMSYFDGENISAIYSSLGEALDGKIPGLRYDRNANKVIVKPRSSINTPMYAIWDIDGVIYEDEPPMDLNIIKSIRVLKTLAGTNRYGSDGAGGVIVVQTKNGSFNPVEDQRKKIAEQYTNKNYYSNDASQVNLEHLNANTYADALEAFNNKQKAFIYYDQTLKTKVKSYSDHISIAQKFITFYKDANLSKQVLQDLAFANPNNAEILKAIAYQFQALGLKRETIKTYETIFKLRPKYAQSYRDLANAYLENNQFKKAWRMYMSYLLQGNDVSGEGIGELLYNEMEFLYYNRPNQTNIKEKFIPKSDNLFDFRNDVRLVFEWNTSEAEFDLEFVNQDKRAYVFEHSLAANQELITNEKEKGYSSKEFFIDDIGEGNWLVNITYKGNKKPEPTYFKVTKYFNWGKATQTQEIAVYKFQNEREKMQLIRLNKQVLVTSN